MPIVVKAKKNQNTSDLIRQFKKLTSAADIVQIVRDRRYHQKPSKKKSMITSERNRLKKRARSLKRMKNISPTVISKINQRLGN